MIPAFSPYYTVNIKTKKDVSVVILLNDQPYREYSVNYENESAALTQSYEFVPPATEPTEAETEEPYEEPTEPPAEEEYEE